MFKKKNLEDFLLICPESYRILMRNFGGKNSNSDIFYRCKLIVTVPVSGRFLICMIFYALMDLSHWWPITLSTAGTVAFLIAKVKNRLPQCQG
jgi:hypothetical protein